VNEIRIYLLVMRSFGREHIMSPRPVLSMKRTPDVDDQ